MNVTRVRTAMLLVLLLAACSDAKRDPAPGSTTPAAGLATAGSAASDTTPGSAGVTLIDPGAEPRTQLGLVRPGSTELGVSATSTFQGTIGDDPFRQEVAARYRLRVDLTEDEMPGHLVARFTPTMVEMSGFVEPREPGPWEWRLDSNGVLMAVDSPAVDPGTPLGALLSPHGLFVMVPRAPVGVGARWRYLASSTDPPVEVLLEAIGDDELTTTMSARSESAGARITTTAAGRWDRTSLVAVEVTGRIDAELTATTTRNGEEVPVVGSRIVELTYEVSP